MQPHVQYVQQVLIYLTIFVFPVQYNAELVMKHRHHNLSVPHVMLHSFLMKLQEIVLTIPIVYTQQSSHIFLTQQILTINYGLFIHSSRTMESHSVENTMYWEPNSWFIDN